MGNGESIGVGDDHVGGMIRGRGGGGNSRRGTCGNEWERKRKIESRRRRARGGENAEKIKVGNCLLYSALFNPECLSGGGKCYLIHAVLRVLRAFVVNRFEFILTTKTRRKNAGSISLLLPTSITIPS
jgi:hypothetical protein